MPPKQKHRRTIRKQKIFIGGGPDDWLQRIKSAISTKKPITFKDCIIPNFHIEDNIIIQKALSVKIALQSILSGKVSEFAEMYTQLEKSASDDSSSVSYDRFHFLKSFETELRKAVGEKEPEQNEVWYIWYLAMNVKEELVAAIKPAFFN